MTRILIVEDDPIIAIDLAEQLKAEGFGVVGPAASADRGVELVAGEGCEIAVLDVNLGGETSARVAEELRRRGIPFFVLSGYSHDQHPPVFTGARMFVKPVCMRQLITELRAMA